MSNYRLTYSKAEDRLLLSIENGQTSAALTRRLTRSLLQTLAKAIGEQKSAASGKSEALRNTIMGFEHAKATTEAFGEGRARREKHQAPDPGSCKVATVVELAVRQSGGAILTFKHADEKVLALNLNRDGTYLFIASVAEMATTAEWDFGTIASWLEPAAATAAEAGAKVLH